MKIQILRECGYEEAMFGLGLSYGLTSQYYDWEDVPEETRIRIIERSLKLHDKDLGHNKFLEQMMIWFDITAPRYWWVEADTYRISSKSSESTMHTIMRNSITESDFEYEIKESTLIYLNFLLGAGKFEELKNELPEGYLQRRMWIMSYKTLRNIVAQRMNHKLGGWGKFCEYVVDFCEHPEYLPTMKER